MSSFSEDITRRMDAILDALDTIQGLTEAQEGAPLSENRAFRAFRASLLREIPEIRRLIRDTATGCRPD